LEFREWEQFGRRTAVTTTGTLTIAVVDADSGSPALGIALMITGETKEMSGQTDRQGKFTCALSAGDYRVSASAPETRRVSQSVTLRTEGETRVTLKLPADPSWRRAIQVGDILYNPCTLFIGVYLGVYLGHTGIYIGGGVTADPRLDGILHPLESWDNLAEVQLLRVRCPHANPGCATAAASWAASVARRTATSYNYQVPVFGDPVFQKDPDENETEWYCSELVWAAYYNQGVDIEAPLGGQANSSSSLHYSPIFPVSPDEICEDADTFYVSGHRGGLPIEGTGERCNCRDRAKIRATCPVDLVLKDSAGRVVSKTENQIPDSVYWIDDLNYDGSPDAEIAFSPTDGVYSVTVLPWESATAMDVFTLQYFGQGGAAPITIADRHALPSTDVLSYELRIQGGVLQLPEQVTPEPTPPLPVDPGPKPPPPPPPPPVGNGGMWILLPCAVMVAAAIAAVFMSLQRRRRKRRQDEDR
ncbi:MAG: carboxypeptidase regulatory-like domain-containing protein, partial [Candidatus Bipolaricaulia bacterium]